MRQASTLVLAGVLAFATTACETVNPDEYLKFAVDHSYFEGRSIYARLKTRRGVTQSFGGIIPANAKAMVLWFPGLEGLGGNQGMDSVFLTKEIGFVNVQPPSDRPGGFICCNSPFRHSTYHLRDVGAVIGYLKKETGLPIWLMGWSMGTVSIANVATNLPDAIDGVVFMSSITSFHARGGRARGETMVTEFNLDKIKVPVLAIAHAQDSDSTTPPGGAEAIVRQATNAPVKEAKIYSAGPGVAPHERFHTFDDNRVEVAEYVAKFILANTKGRPKS